MNKDISKWLIFDGCVTLQFEIDHDDGDLLFVLSKLIQWLMLQFGCGDWTKKTKKLLQFEFVSARWWSVTLSYPLNTARRTR